MKKEANSSEWKIQEMGDLFQDKFNFQSFPKISIIIPTFNSLRSISLTLDSVVSQDYPDFEILIIDGGSSDHTLEVVNSYLDPRIHISSVLASNYFEMCNKGILQSKGVYLNFLHSGDCYLHQKALKCIVSLLQKKNYPDLLYSATTVQEGKEKGSFYFHDMTQKTLEQGKMPTSLNSCWFLKETISTSGKFDKSFIKRGDFELILRLFKRGIQTSFLNRVLTDHYFPLLERSDWTYSKETFLILARYFGWKPVFRWAFFGKVEKL